MLVVVLPCLLLLQSSLGEIIPLEEGVMVLTTDNFQAWRCGHDDDDEDNDDYEDDDDDYDDDDDDDDCDNNDDSS